MEALHNNWNPMSVCVHQVSQAIFCIYPLLGHFFFLPSNTSFSLTFFPQSIKSMKYKQALALHTSKCTIQAL